VFSPDIPIVAPSGSCVAMVAHRMPVHYDVWELSSFLDHLGAEPPARNDGLRLAYHSSCHLLRDLGVDEAPRRLLERTGAELVPLNRPDLCCGFGGTFSVRHAEVSVAMADDKLADGGRADALVTADPGCLMHLQARAAKTGAVRIVHLATALARGAA
jgi:L-lactate dehydrogenase complex protein LldE